MPSGEGVSDIENSGNYCATQCTGLCIAFNVYTPSRNCYAYSSLTNNPTDSTTNNPTASTYIACIKNRLPDLISIVWKEKAAKCALVLALGRESLSGIRESREWVSYGLIDVRTD